uniref:Uncharacterized protein n=1 Tax=Anopheles minimus TaxID=112268 RepID=A0A182WNR3_9DIPT
MPVRRIGRMIRHTTFTTMTLNVSIMHKEQLYTRFCGVKRQHVWNVS